MSHRRVRAAVAAGGANRRAMRKIVNSTHISLDGVIDQRRGLPDEAAS